MTDTPTILITESDGEFGPAGLSTETGQLRAVDLSDKLTIINQALINTGNNPVNVGDDTSDEWITASSAFEQWVPILLYRRNWGFAERLQVLNRMGDASYPGYSDVYAKPADCLFLIDVYRPDVARLVSTAAYQSEDRRRDNTRPPGLEYKIVADRINCRAPNGAVALYTPFPVGSQPWSVGFVAALRLKIEATLYRALNEDMSASYQSDRFAEAALQEAAARADQEEPRKVAFRSPLAEARWRRRGV